MTTKHTPKRGQPKRRRAIREPSHVDAAAFIAMKGVEPFDPVRFGEMVDGLWPDHESVDDFIAWRRNLGKRGRK